MKIKKDGKTITLSESDLKKINNKIIAESFNDYGQIPVGDFIGSIVDDILGYLPTEEREGLIKDIMHDMRKMIYSYLHEY